MISDSIANRNSNDGFELQSDAVAVRNTAWSNGTGSIGSGFRVVGTRNRIEGNHATWGGQQAAGFVTAQVDNAFFGNTAMGHGASNYTIATSAASSGPIGPATDTHPRLNVSVP